MDDELLDFDGLVFDDFYNILLLYYIWYLNYIFIYLASFINEILSDY